MKHFEYFPLIEYNNDQATNLLVRGRVRQLLTDNSTAFYNYVVADNERPDHIAYAYYESTNYTWSILYANNIFDMIYDWPLSQQNFNSYIISKYGSIENTQSLADESLLLTLGVGSGAFVSGQTVFQGVDIFTATSQGIVTDWNSETRMLRLKDVQGDFHRLSGNVRNAFNTASYEVTRRRDIVKQYEIASGEYEGVVISKADFLDPLQFIDEGKNVLTVYEYEERINENKRSIKLIKPSVVYAMANELRTLFS